MASWSPVPRALVLGGLALSLLSSCFLIHNECPEGDVRCDGNVAAVCELGMEGFDGTWWSKTECGDRHCVMDPDAGTPYAVCSVLPEKDPACAGILYWEDQRCANGKVISCEQEYRTQEETCEAFCVESPRPMCALSSTPDPLCLETDESRTACDGDMRIVCKQGYRIEERDCGPGLCYTTSTPGDSSTSNNATCILSAVEDPRCYGRHVATSQGTAGDLSGCDENNVHYECLEGYLIAEEPCGSQVCGYIKKDRFDWSVACNVP